MTVSANNAIHKTCLLLTVFVSSLLFNGPLLAKNATDSKLNSADLSSFEWENRVILFHSPYQCSKTRTIFNNDAQALNERHIVWFLICDTNNQATLNSNYQQAIDHDFTSSILSAYFKQRQPSVVLMGKDGGIKYRSPSLDLKTIYQIINAMPMRRLEMGQEN